MKLQVFATIPLMIIIIAVSQAAAHPADGCQPGPMPDNYGTPTHHDIGELQFDYDFLPWDSLTSAEQYMIVGGASEKGEKLTPWWLKICEAAVFYNETNGVIPGQYSADMLVSMAAEPTAITEEHLTWLCSPLTGQLPQLKAEGLIPGSVYIRELTPAETEEAAQQDSVLRQALIGEYTDPYTGETRGIELLTKVYYYRINGLNSVLQASLFYVWSYTD